MSIRIAVRVDISACITYQHSFVRMPRTTQENEA